MFSDQVEYSPEVVVRKGHFLPPAKARHSHPHPHPHAHDIAVVDGVWLTHISYLFVRLYVQLQTTPRVSWPSDPTKRWTLIMTTPGTTNRQSSSLSLSFLFPDHPLTRFFRPLLLR